jgi:stage II sporulation protein D
MVLAALLAIAATAPAQGASRLVVRGAGFGHGVGMSQYGALGFAKQGKDHAFILRHYYTGAQLGKLAGPSRVRVLLKSARRIVFSGVSGVAGRRALDPGLSYSAVRGLGGAVTLRTAAGNDIGTYQSPLTITGLSSGFVLRGRAANGVVGGSYRGNLQISAPAIGGLSAINALDLEDYLRGVVPGEVPSNWPHEALRAQAVAARTYAIATSKAGADFDQYADTRSQVYKGMAVEQPTTNAAVAATSGEVVSFNGKPIVTYYFSTSGGRTEDIENSFLGAQPAPYLVSVDDPFDGASPRHRWVVRMSLGQARRRLGELVDGSLRQIKVLRRGKSPRVVRAQIVGSSGRKLVSGPQLRRKLGLYDTWAQFTVITAKGARGDGSKPSSSPGTGTSAGGAIPRLARSASFSQEVAGTITGRVAPAVADGWVRIERLVGSRWVSLFEARTGVDGRYHARVRVPARYRVRYRGEAGPVVRAG